MKTINGATWSVFEQSSETGKVREHPLRWLFSLNNNNRKKSSRKIVSFLGKTGHVVQCLFQTATIKNDQIKSHATKNDDLSIKLNNIGNI